MCNSHIVIDTGDLCIQVSRSSVFPTAYMRALVTIMVPFLCSLLVFLASFTLADQLGNIICDSWPMHSGTGSEKAFFGPKVAVEDGFQDIWY